MARVVVVGFGPFPGAPKNPSTELVRRLVRRRRPALADTTILSAIVPTAYAAVTGEFTELLRMHDPDAVLMFGIASRAQFMRVERRAVNFATGFYPDVTRAKLATRQVLPEIASELPVRAHVGLLISAGRATGIDVRPSRDAGRYICNAALLVALAAAKRSGRPRRVAFVHIPRPRRHRYARKGKARPAMDSLVRAGEAVLVALLADLRRG
jgi:pyroglutamyl-peptidase